ncbi:unnamed protein product [Orchesella dallaii]|uniref:F-box domain-containing protein n=1 Tax=Orchesella dallaii TaxID=48710 RepID=A0ABP1S847_9HEXA
MVGEEQNLGKTMKPMEVSRVEENNFEKEEDRGVFKSPITNPMLLPENWELILSDLDPTDFLAAINTCPNWNLLMHTKKTDKLMPLVFPLLLEYLSPSEIIKCRSISTLLKRMINSTLQQNILSSPTSSEFDDKDLPFWIHDVNSLHSKTHWVRRQLKFDTPKKLQTFHEWASTLAPRSNRILTSHVTLVIGRGGVDCPPDNVRNLTSFLYHFGSQISSFSLEIRGGYHCSSVCRLFATLRYLPNLQILKLQAKIPVGELRFCPPPADLPHLPKLEALNVMLFQSGDTRSEFTLIMPFLLHYGRQLKLLSCGGRIINSPNLYFERLNKYLPNLKSLLTMCLSPPIMMKLAMMDWKLERLELVQYNKPQCTLVDLIRVTNNFQESLINLEIDIVLQPDQRVDLNEMKELGNLQKLTVGFHCLDHDWFWDFLKVSCCRIKELHWKVLPQPTRALTKEHLNKAGKAFWICPKLEKSVFWFSMAHFKNKPKTLWRHEVKQQLVLESD